MILPEFECAWYYLSLSVHDTTWVWVCRSVCEEDDLGVHDEDVEGGALPGRPEHVDEVLGVAPAELAVLADQQHVAVEHVQ